MPCTVARTAASWPRPMAKSTVRCSVVRSRGGMVGVVESTRPLDHRVLLLAGQILVLGFPLLREPMHRLHHVVVVEADMREMQLRTRASFSKYTGSEVPPQGSENTGCMKSGRDDVEAGVTACGTSFFLPQVARLGDGTARRSRQPNRRSRPRSRRAVRGTAWRFPGRRRPGVSSASSAAISAKVYM